MEYTKDIIFDVKYNKKTRSLFRNFKNIKILKLLKKIKQIIQKDYYFTLTMIISILFLSIDYLIIKRFIEIVNLL